MKISQSTWATVLRLEREFNRRGENLSRTKISDALQVTDNTAKLLHFGLENRDIIRLDPFKVKSTEDDIELILADLHFPFQDQLALDTVLAYADELQPTIITLLGDCIDFYKASRWIKNPTKKSVHEEIKIVRQFLEDLRQRFPKARIIYKKGNHEDRLDNYIMSNASEIYELINDLLEVKLNLPALNIEFISEHFKIGKLWHLHGHEKPGGSYNPEYVCNVMWKYCHDHFVVGHFHRNQKKTFKKIDGSLFWTASIGYLATEMEYALLNAWSRGFGVVRYASNGYFKGEVHDVHNGEIF